MPASAVPVLAYDPEGYNCPRMVHPNTGSARLCEGWRGSKACATVGL